MLKKLVFVTLGVGLAAQMRATAVTKANEVGCNDVKTGRRQMGCDQRPRGTLVEESVQQEEMKVGVRWPLFAVDHTDRCVIIVSDND